VPSGLKHKDLVGIPWRVAFALQADGWYLRQDIIWAKPNPMPESVRDRCTKAHEYLFLLSKSERYYFDAAAIKEAAAYPDDKRRPLGSKGAWQMDGREQGENGGGKAYDHNTETRNKRSVWTVATQPYSGAHFATFPPKLIEPCILAGSRSAGKRCDCDEIIATPTGTGEIVDQSLETGRAGMNRQRRENEGTRPITRREQRDYAKQIKKSSRYEQMEQESGAAFAHYIRTDASGARPAPPELLNEWLERGWLVQPEPCTCLVADGDLVLDPFAGSGTTIQVAQQLGRRGVGIELNPAYITLADTRTAQTGLAL